ncbi:MAG: radical SAM family heme chaperone HemW [Oscillospiraceae bacterium]|jgi:oxygen-independent coproporphyrinogen-3 oxidase|nr:radical SAM family heme chaperone HemW [Oscillospiraceae bacterium]
MKITIEKLAPEKRKNLGVYIHIPFCRQRCGYCNFCSVVPGRGGEQMDRYARALTEHISEYASLLDDYIIDTVYFGGGTPTFFGADRIVTLLDDLKRMAHVSLNAEISIEANPDSVDMRGLSMLKNAGVNRISIGVQSGNDKMLSDLGRVHSFRQASNAVSLARVVGFDNISVDYMFGLPNQTLSEHATSLARVLDLNPDHMSCYCLELKDDTSFYEAYKDSLFLPDADLQADMFLYAADILTNAGFDHYEISNYAKPGKRCRHNMKYWLRENYLGFGASAASCMSNTRFSFISDVEKYTRGVLGGKDRLMMDDDYFQLPQVEQLKEYIMLGLRTSFGLNSKKCEELYDSLPESFEELLAEWTEIGLLENTVISPKTDETNGEQTWVPTEKGFLLADRMAVEMSVQLQWDIDKAKGVAAPLLSEGNPVPHYKHITGE